MVKLIYGDAAIDRDIDNDNGGEERTREGGGERKDAGVVRGKSIGRITREETSDDLQSVATAARNRHAIKTEVRKKEGNKRKEGGKGTAPLMPA